MGRGLLTCVIKFCKAATSRLFGLQRFDVREGEGVGEKKGDFKLHLIELDTDSHLSLFLS